MTYEEVINRIEKYLLSDSTGVVIVDFPSAELHENFVSHFHVGNNKVVSTINYSSQDNLPMLDRIEDELSRNNSKLFLVGLSVILMLYGERSLRKELRELLDLQCSGKVIVLTLGCSDYLSHMDNRLIQSGKIRIVDGKNNFHPLLFFVAEKYKPSNYYIGIEKLPRIISSYKDECSSFSFITSKKKIDFTESMFNIKVYDSDYNVLTEVWPELSVFEESIGTADQWEYLFEEQKKYDSYQEYLMTTFGSSNTPSIAMSSFSLMDEKKRWALYIALRIFGAKNNNYLSIVISKSETYDDFIANTFFNLLQYSINDNSFTSLYEDRKCIISQMLDYKEYISEYCKRVYSKEKNAIYYLTDLTKMEKECIIDISSRYAWNRYDLEQVLCCVYPDLSIYLSHYDFHNPFLTKYFDLYRFSKVTNKIDEEFINLVHLQAKERQYNEWLRPRSLVVDGICKDSPKSILFFIDALGAEYVGYIQEKCYELGLTIKVEVARCDLPSITSINKNQIIDEFKTAGCKIFQVSELDELKHSGGSSYNYENNKIPIHIVSELEIINKLLEQLRTIDKDEVAYVISDHGASRLAVIYENENKWEVSEKGIHSGRCCPISDISEKPDYATEENGFWCLANYDRFKGGRKANVEVHGGASLEEVTVPVLTISKKSKEIKCSVLGDNIIWVSFKRKAKLQLFVEIDSDNITINVNDRSYKAVKTDVPYHYEIEMADIKTSGKYLFNVYSDTVLIAKQMEFEVKKEGASERKLF